MRNISTYPISVTYTYLSTRYAYLPIHLSVIYIYLISDLPSTISIYVFVISTYLCNVYLLIPLSVIFNYLPLCSIWLPIHLSVSSICPAIRPDGDTHQWGSEISVWKISRSSSYKVFSVCPYHCVRVVRSYVHVRSVIIYKSSAPW